jgi:hypothetical protein
MDLTALGWSPVHDAWGAAKDYPQNYAKIQIFRAGWEEPRTLNWSDIHPAMNVNGLYWRPVKKVQSGSS